jgi:anti-sigma factor RsiW
MNSKRITDLDIQALVDGEVDEKTSVALLQAVTNDPNLYNRYMLYQKQKKLLKSWWKDN